MRQRRMVSFRGGQGGSRTTPTGEGSPGSAEGAPSGGMDSCLRRKDGWGVAVWGRPPLDPSIRLSRREGWDLQHAQGERPHLGDGFTPWRIFDRLSAAGMTEGEWGGGCGDLNGLCPVEAGLPLDPSIPLRVSGPTLGMDSGSGAGMTIMQRSHRERCRSLGGLT